MGRGCPWSTYLNENLTVATGGAYEMGRIAREVPSMHWTVMEILTAPGPRKRNQRRAGARYTVDIADSRGAYSPIFRPTAASRLTQITAPLGWS